MRHTFGAVFAAFDLRPLRKPFPIPSALLAIGCLLG
jgi:hypothetical protein